MNPCSCPLGHPIWINWTLTGYRFVGDCRECDTTYELADNLRGVAK